MDNNVCRNFNFNEKVDGTLEVTRLNCERCEFNGHCVIQATTYYNDKKDYAVSMEFVDMKGEPNEN